MADKSKKKIAIVGVCSLILVAMVVALTIGIRENEKPESPEISASQKAITALCQSTDYQEACVKSLKATGEDTSDPKELIERAFQVAIKYIDQAVNNSTLFDDLESDPRAKSAVDGCRELADRAVNDLQRSFDKFKQLDFVHVDDVLDDLKIWLSGAITYQETCLDGFDGVEGDAGDRMRASLTEAMQMTSNGLAMVTSVSSFLDSIGIQGFYTRRRLLDQGDELPGWVEYERRELLSKAKWNKPDLVVAKDGSGKYRTINEALLDVPKNSDKPFVLYVKEGVYEEKVHINSSLVNLMLVGDGPTKTRITGRLNYIDGVSTYHTATVAVQADNFTAINIGFENSAGAEKHQAVALRVSADRAVFFKCQMDGYQDTLYAHTYRQFYRNCVISGTIDFIFGDSAAVFQNCTMVLRRPMNNQQNIVTAQGRKDVRQPTGLVLQNCSFVAAPEYYPFRHKLKSYLGRPWKEYSRTVIMESYIDDVIQPQGWLPWNATFALDTLFYTEFNNRGPGSDKSARVKWSGVKELPAKRVKRFTVAHFLDGKRWIRERRVPCVKGFIFPLPEEDPNVKYSPVSRQETKDLGRSGDKSSFIFKEPHHKKGKHHRAPAPAPISESYIAASPMTDSYAPAPAPRIAAAPGPDSSYIAAAPGPDSSYIAAAPGPYSSYIAAAPTNYAYAPSANAPAAPVKKTNSFIKMIFNRW